VKSLLKKSIAGRLSDTGSGDGESAAENKQSQESQAGQGDDKSAGATGRKAKGKHDKGERQEEKQRMEKLVIEEAAETRNERKGSLLGQQAELQPRTPSRAAGVVSTNHIGQQQPNTECRPRQEAGMIRYRKRTQL
jgi:hypothetical protein